MRGAIAQPAALATVLWLVGENLPYHVVMAAAAPDCFRVFVQKFTSLEPNVKEEVLRLGCKVWLHLDGTGELVERFRKIFAFALELAKYDDYYAIRDHARIFECALERESDTFKALKTTLLGEKSPPMVNESDPECSGYELGTFSQLWGHPVGPYEELPAWRVEPPDDTVRISLEEAALESKFAQDDNLTTCSSDSLSFHDDPREKTSSDSNSDTNSSGSASRSVESSVETSEMFEEIKSDSLPPGTCREGAQDFNASSLNSRAPSAAGGKIIVRFSKHVNPAVTSSTMKSPTEAAPQITQTSQTLCDAPNQTDAKCAESLETEGQNLAPN
ncbi:unnamed protein product [Phytomonas sp. Hart1]|nr:unnamed protein product [Phytomonas sp. Hart1]|eukprot:CCW69947.1 unnamed protein product [Phytomonas sp. isolate Hart1]